MAGKPAAVGLIRPVGRATLVLGLALLLGAPALGYAAAGWLRRSSPPAPQIASTRKTPAEADPQPVFVGASAAVIAAAIDDTSGLPMHQALQRLAEQWLGRGYNAFPLDRGPQEELRIDLTRFDYGLFVEQLLALVHSRGGPKTITPQQRMAAHVRRLRYIDGQVSFCTRQHYFSRWAEAAERQGYLVNLTPHLPGVRSRRRSLQFVSRHAQSYEPLRDPDQRRCLEARERNLSVQQPWLPLSALAGVKETLRSGDLYALVSDSDGIDVSDAGVIDQVGERITVIHAAPGEGVRRSPDLSIHAAGVPLVIGVAFYRPVPMDQPLLLEK